MWVFISVCTAAFLVAYLPLRIIVYRQTAPSATWIRIDYLWLTTASLGLAGGLISYRSDSINSELRYAESLLESSVDDACDLLMLTSESYYTGGIRTRSMPAGGVLLQADKPLSPATADLLRRTAKSIRSMESFEDPPELITVYKELLINGSTDDEIATNLDRLQAEDERYASILDIAIEYQRHMLESALRGDLIILSQHFGEFIRPRYQAVTAARQRASGVLFAAAFFRWFSGVSLSLALGLRFAKVAASVKGLAENPAA